MYNFAYQNSSLMLNTDRIPEKSRTLLYALFFSITLLAQCMIFHYLAFHNSLWSYIYYDPIKFWAFYLPKIGICLFIAAFVPLFRKKGWTIVMSLILAVWILAELVYYRVNSFFLDAYSFTMIGNMKGFWDSVLAFIRPVDIAIALPTLCLAVALYFLKPGSNSGKTAVTAFIVSMVLHIMGMVLLDIKINRDPFHNSYQSPGIVFNPFSDEGSKKIAEWSETVYASRTSVIHCLILDAWGLIKMSFPDRKPLTPQDVAFNPEIQLFNETSPTFPTPKRNLYIVLFESLENWAVTPQATPAIYNFIQSHHSNVMWAQRIKNQTRGGTSGDGQMIVNAGILPISSGATCFRFPANCYPSLSELYETATMIIPGNLSVWNQERMSDAYHIAENIVVPESEDSTTFSILNDIYREYPYVMVLSVASHTPFHRCPDSMKLKRDKAMPATMADYLDCVHYTDSFLGEFLEKVDTDKTLRNSTIVITGDHTIFDNDLRRKFNEYCISSGEKYKVMEAYCPFIMYSPSIKENTIVEEEVYQMDIYPTVLHVIGCDSSYYWKGFGINLLDREAVRPLTEEEAFSLSEKMILADYWNYRKNGQ